MSETRFLSWKLNKIEWNGELSSHTFTIKELLRLEGVRVIFEDFATLIVADINTKKISAFHITKD